MSELVGCWRSELAEAHFRELRRDGNKVSKPMYRLKDGREVVITLALPVGKTPTPPCWPDYKFLGNGVYVGQAK